MKAADFRALALALADTEEGAHLGKADFRRAPPGRIFATLPSDDVGVVLLTPEQQAVVLRTAPAMFAKVKGGWGEQGATQVLLAKVSTARARDALTLAWSNRAPKPKAARTRRAKR